MEQIVMRMAFYVFVVCVVAANSAAEANANTPFLCHAKSRITNALVIKKHADASLGPQVSDALKKLGVTPFGLMVMDNRWKTSDGMEPNSDRIVLGIHFIEGTVKQRSFVKRLAAEWLSGNLAKRISFQFDVPSDRAQIRIGFAQDGEHKGNWSWAGREALTYHRTMNIQDLTRRVVLHEFGHALGLEHEHQHPTSGIIWNEAAIIADMVPPWEEDDVKTFITDRLSSDAACIGDKKFNRSSIMIYEIPKCWTKNGFSTPYKSTLPSAIAGASMLCIHFLKPLLIWRLSQHGLDCPTCRRLIAAKQGQSCSSRRTHA